MSEFKVGDLVEVLPAPKGAGSAWWAVSGMRGAVTLALSDPVVVNGLSVEVQFPAIVPWDGKWWCDPAWLRLRSGFAKREPCPCGHDAPQYAPCFCLLAAAPRRGEGELVLPRFKRDERVELPDGRKGTIQAVDTEPRYLVLLDGSQGPMNVKESTLRPAVPVKCAPDGTRCAAWKEQAVRVKDVSDPSTWWQYAPFCPWCGGQLREGA